MASGRRLIENLKYLSAVTRYNTERRPPLRSAAHSLLNTEEIYHSHLSKSDIKPLLEEQHPKNSSSNSNLETLLFTWPDDPYAPAYQFYLMVRYQGISEVLRDEFAFSAIDMISMEALIFNLITKSAGVLGISKEYHQFSSKEEFARIDDYTDPEEDFLDKWGACIQFSRSDLFDEFLAETQEWADEFGLDSRLETADKILNFLTADLSGTRNEGTIDLFRTPIVTTDRVGKRLFVPFPRLLVNTAQVRVERLFEDSSVARKEEESTKGEVVEDLVTEAFNHFESRNFVRGLRFNDPHPRESDGLLIFEDSYWVVEVKSHPVFRKVPHRPDIAVNRARERVESAIEQGRHAIEYLEDQNPGLLFNLSGIKNPDEKESGLIIVLDGFLPTLFSQNRRADQMSGFDKIYADLQENERVYLITLFDLFEIADQEEHDRLEEFLLWRTGYAFDMPIFAYNERDYWAMYFDLLDADAEMMATIDEASSKGMLVPYISDRFNDKPYLPEDGF